LGHGAGGEGDGAGFGDGGMDGIADEAAELVGDVDREGGIDPAFDVDAQGASGPARAGVGDALDAGGGVFGRDEHAVVDAVEQAVGDLGGDFIADVADEQGDGGPGDLAECDRDEPDQRSGGGQRASQECLASLIRVADWIRRPTRSL
jgi:hypothetical protein